MFTILKAEIQRSQDANVALAIAERAITSYPWAEKQVEELASEALSKVQVVTNRTAISSLFERIFGRSPSVGRRVLETFAATPSIIAAAVISIWEQLQPERLGMNTYRVHVPNQDWVVRVWDSVVREPMTSASASARCPFSQWYVLRAQRSTTTWVGVRPYISGSSLTVTQRDMPWERIKEMFSMIAQALDCLHAGNAYHGEILSDNIIIRADQAILINEALDGFSSSPQRPQQTVQDQIQWARLLCDSIELRGFKIGKAISSEIEAKAKTLSAANLVEEVWQVMADREIAREHLRSILDEDEFTQRISTIAMRNASNLSLRQLEEQKRSLEKQISDLNLRVDMLNPGQDPLTHRSELQRLGRELDALKSQVAYLQRIVSKRGTTPVGGSYGSAVESVQRGILGLHPAIWVILVLSCVGFFIICNSLGLVRPFASFIMTPFTMPPTPAIISTRTPVPKVAPTNEATETPTIGLPTSTKPSQNGPPSPTLRPTEPQTTTVKIDNTQEKRHLARTP